MNDHQLLNKYWNTFGHLDLEPGEMLDKDDIVGSEAFTEKDADRLIILLSMSSDSLESLEAIVH
jgi:hypothetical protein